MAKKRHNNFRKRCKEFTPEDHANKNEVYTKVKKFCADHSYPPKGWHLYSENPNTVCQYVMKSVRLSHGQDKKNYWDHFAESITNRCWIDLRAIKDT